VDIDYDKLPKLKLRKIRNILYYNINICDFFDIIRLREVSMRNPKIGFIATSCPQHVNGKDGLGKPMVSKEHLNDALKFLKNQNYDVINYDDEGIVDTSKKTWNAMTRFICEEVDCIVMYFAAWHWITHYMQAIRKANIPVIGWSPNIAQGWNLNNVGVTKGAMREWGIPFRGVWGLPGDAGLQKKIDDFVKAAKVKNVLEHSKFGLIGGTSMGIACGFADFNEWGKKFGIFMEHTDELVVIEEARSVPEKQVKETYKYLETTYGAVPPLDEQTDRAIRHYLGYEKVITENGYDFCALKCTFDASSYYVSGCLSQALLAQRGFVSSCEGDCYAALTCRILSALTDEPFFTADVQHMKMEEKIAVLVDDGTANPKIASSLNHVYLKHQWAGEAQNGGVSIGLVAKPGKVTLARICRVGDGKHECLITKGETFDVPKEKVAGYCGCGMPDWPHAFVKLEGDPDKFVDEMNVEYVHMVYGDLVDQLKEVCNLLGVEPVVID
jgi:L-fucose isomerase